MYPVQRPPQNVAGRRPLPWTVSQQAWSENPRNKKEKKPEPPVEEAEAESVPTVSIPGVNRILSKKTHIAWKIAWCLMLLLNLVLCGFHLSGLIDRYRFQSVTMYSGINEYPAAEFPIITLCPSADVIANPRVTEYLQQALNQPSLSNADLWRQTKNISAEDVWEAAEFDIPFVHYLSCSIKDDCTYQVARKKKITYKGLCHYFTVREPIPFRGRYTFLFLRVNVPNDSDSAVFLYAYHNQSESIRHTYYEKQETALRGTVRNISFFMREDYYLNFMTRPCTDDPNAADCINKCLDRLLSNELKCKLPHMITPKLPPCHSPATIHEAYTKMLEVYKKTKPKHCPCLRRCYEITIDKINTNIKVENYTDLELTFRFEYIWREFMKELLIYNTVAFLSDVGGSLGLFLGFSILSILEIFEWVILPKKPAATSTKVTELQPKPLRHTIPPRSRVPVPASRYAFQANPRNPRNPPPLRH